VSAAAAALLAVAPVAATAIQPATVSAATDNISSSLANANNKLSATSVKANSNIVARFPEADSLNNTGLTRAELQGLNVPNGFEAKNGKVDSISVSADGNKVTQTLKFNLAWNDGNKADAADYLADGLTINNEGLVANKNGVAIEYTITRQVIGTSAQGTPYFFEKSGKNAGAVVEDNKGSVQLNNIDGANNSGTFTAQQLLTLIEKTYGYGHNAGSAEVKAETDAADVAAQLTKQGVNKTANGLTFDYPAENFTIDYKVKAENGKTATLVVKVNTNDFNINNPSFGFDDSVIREGATTDNYKRYANNSTLTVSPKIFNYKKDGKAGFQALLNKGDFTAYVSGNQNNNDFIGYNVDASKVDTTKNGLYPITITSDKNPAGYTSKITFYVYSGDTTPEAVMYVKSETPIVTIDGNNVTTTSNKVAAGTALFTKGSVTINGTEYTRVSTDGKFDTQEFVKSSDLTDTKPAPAAPSAVAQTGSKKVMWKSYVYDQNGKRVGDKTISAYETIPVYGTKTINGKTYYRVSATAEEYVNANNIDGTSRTLSHNAYVYKNNGKAYTYKKTVKKGKKHVKKTYKKLAKKGDSVTTFGTTKTINGKKYYRVGYNKYIKVANFHK
ncbi:SLAP domain-containing protein, partial [Lactobacillus hamsteri]